jgi:hypothetical protein
MCGDMGVAVPNGAEVTTPALRLVRVVELEFGD